MLKFFKSNIFFFLLLTIVVFSLYGKSINFDFTYHDDDSLIKNQVQFLSDINDSNAYTIRALGKVGKNPIYLSYKLLISKYGISLTIASSTRQFFPYMYVSNRFGRTWEGEKKKKVS